MPQGMMSSSNAQQQDDFRGISDGQRLLNDELVGRADPRQNNIKPVIQEDAKEEE